MDLIKVSHILIFETWKFFQYHETFIVFKQTDVLSIKSISLKIPIKLQCTPYFKHWL